MRKKSAISTIKNLDNSSNVITLQTHAKRPLLLIHICGYLFHSIIESRKQSTHTQAFLLSLHPSYYVSYRARRAIALLCTEVVNEDPVRVIGQHNPTIKSTVIARVDTPTKTSSGGSYVCWHKAGIIIKWACTKACCLTHVSGVGSEPTCLGRIAIACSCFDVHISIGCGSDRRVQSKYEGSRCDSEKIVNIAVRQLCCSTNCGSCNGADSQG